VGKLNRLLRKGIEPIIAVVILVAVTLVIAIGVVGWIMGWWGTLGATESLQFYPDSYIQIGAGQNTLILHVKNSGSASAVIYKVEITGVATITTPGTDVATLAPGQETEIRLPFTETVTAGANYLVRVYTRAGNVYSVTVQAKA
jgi:flagellin-like protein